MKINAKRIIAFLSGVFVGITSSLCIIVSAAEPANGDDVLNDTRYSAFGWLPIDDLLEGLIDVANGEIPSNGVFGAPEKLIDKFASQVAINAFKELQGKQEGYTIKDIYSCICKRKIVYPINGYEELQYLYVYINENANAQTQNFGNYTIAPNTMLLVRQTNFSGTMVYSIPIALNNINCSWGNGGDLCRIIIPDNSNFTMYTPDGAETFLIESARSGESMYVAIVNNDYNTIVDTHLSQVYNYQPNHDYYYRYMPEGTMNGLEALLGVGYNASLGSEQTTAWPPNNGSPYNTTRPWYMTTLFSNNDTGTGSPSYYSTDNNIDPKKPPAFILPQSSPLYTGKTIDNSTINNYNDYGMTINNNSLDIDPDILAGALAGLIDPDFTGALGGVFNAQPEIGLGFDTPLDLNLPDLVDDYLQSITVYPPSTGWEPPSYPAVNTSAYIPATYPTVPTNTLPSGYAEDMGDVLTNGWDMYDALGLTALFIPIIVLLLFWRFTGD